MTTGLPVSALIAVSVSLSPPAAQAPTVNSMLILGDSNIIDVRERLRSYTALSAVATDFGTSAAEYLAASLYFGQTPQPTTLYIGRWAKTATAGLLRGGVLTGAQQAIANFTGIANGGLKVSIDGSAITNITGINLTAVTTLNGVAAAIQTAVRAIASGGFTLATVVWNATYGQFTIASGTTGALSAVTGTTPPTAGTDLGPLILTTAATLTYLAAGIALESAVTAVTLFDTQVTTPWYGLMFAAGALNADIADSDHLAVAAYIEGATTTSGNGHMYGLTTSAAAALVSPDTTSIGAQLKALGYNRTFYQYSSQNAFACASMFGRFLTVNVAGANTTITEMWKQQPGVVAETLTSTQAAALNAGNYNYYANLNNATAITFNGMLASGQFIDTVWGVDALAGQIQANLFNLLYQSTTKIPQTDQGMQQLSTGVAAACDAFVNNGFLGPGTWTVGGFGQLKQGDFIPTGYYIYIPPISTQSASDRAARKSVPMQVAAKLAGAVHSANVSISVNP